MAVGKFIDHPRVRAIRSNGRIEVVAAVPTEKEPARTMVIGALVVVVLGSAVLAYGRAVDRAKKGRAT